MRGKVREAETGGKNTCPELKIVRIWRVLNSGAHFPASGLRFRCLGSLTLNSLRLFILTSKLIKPLRYVSECSFLVEPHVNRTSRDTGKYLFLHFFPQFYWEVVDIHHHVSLRYTARWFALYILWNDDHSRFSWHPSSHVDTRKRKRKQFSLWWQLLRSALLTALLYTVRQCQL